MRFFLSLYFCLFFLALHRIDIAHSFSSQVLRENEMLRRDVEVKESKLSSSMNSIKTFWSPELKKERALRKDEVSKITVWKEQYRVIQDEAQVSHTFNIPHTNGINSLVSNFILPHIFSFVRMNMFDWMRCDAAFALHLLSSSSGFPLYIGWRQFLNAELILLCSYILMVNR